MAKIYGECKKAQYENLACPPIAVAETGRFMRSTADQINYYTDGVAYFPENERTENTITAFATGGQVNAYQLSYLTSIITVCATAGDSIKLPELFYPGTTYTIINQGAEYADIFPFLGTNINAMAVNLAVQVLPGHTVVLRATVADTTWQTL